MDEKGMSLTSKLRTQITQIVMEGVAESRKPWNDDGGRDLGERKYWLHLRRIDGEASDNREAVGCKPGAEITGD